MKRSTQIGLAAAGVLMVATVWSLTGEDTEENLVYNSLSECQAGGQLSIQQCEAAFSEATAARLKDAPNYRNQSECEAQYGANGCSTASIGGAQFFVYSLLGKTSSLSAISGSVRSRILRTPVAGVTAPVQASICAWCSGSCLRPRRGHDRVDPATSGPGR